MTNHLELPAPIAAYFAADRNDTEAFGHCFSADAVVTDENRTYTGVAAIKAWKAESAAKYSYTCEPFAVDQKAGVTTVSGRVTGNFPGSPVDLRYVFELERGKIATLKIAP